MLCRFLCVCLVSITLVASAEAASSTFDSDDDGWGGGAEITWGDPNGNPGGHLRFVDADGTGTWAEAPSKFLGDWSALDGVGVLSYDHKIFSVGSVNGYRPYQVQIYSGTNCAEWTGDKPSGVTGWVAIDVPIDVNHWDVQQGSWTSILANVTALKIRIEHTDDNHTNNVEGIDNVSGVPEPATLSLLGIGGVALLRRKRK